MSARLLTANIKNDSVILDEVQGLLVELRDAWNAIGAQPLAAASPQAARLSTLASA
jgi:flagellar protein FliS